MTKTAQILLSLLVLLLWIPVAHGGRYASFCARDCAWNATHIVVATEDPVIDGVLTVIESWKGDLDVGEGITIPELARFASEDSREIDKNLREYDSSTPTHITCQKMALFLKKKAPFSEEHTDEASNTQETDKKQWASASSIWDKMYICVAWIENDRIYAFQAQFHSSMLTAFYGPGLEHRSEASLKKLVLEILKVREEFERAISLEDLAKRAEALAPFMRDDIFIVIVMDALDELKKCGKEALPVLRRLLQDQSITGMVRDDIIQLFAKLGGARVGPELTDMLSEEFGYWLTTGPALDKHWWGQNAQTDRYDKLHETLQGLYEVGFEGCKGEVADLRKFWASLPQLAQYDRIIKACDAILGDKHREMQQQSEPADNATTPDTDAEKSSRKQRVERRGDNSQAADFSPRMSRRNARNAQSPRTMEPQRLEPWENEYFLYACAIAAAFVILIALIVIKRKH